MLVSMDELLSIGDFSARCGLSVRMLRSYAAAGLLLPTAVDSSSGYRYYSDAQLEKAQIIGLLRRAGIAIEAITEFFNQPRLELLDGWDSEIVSSSVSRRRALAQARERLALGSSKHRPQETPRAPTEGGQMTTSFESGAATHQGGRQSNQDVWLAAGQLFAVADGMGGHERGDVASRLAVDALEAAFGADPSVGGLLGACREANRVVWQEAQGGPENSIMGTTVVAFALTSDAVGVVAHVGDSRLYRLRGGRLSVLTQDHTVVEESLRSGELTAAEAASHPHRNVLTRAIGVGPHIDVDFSGVSLEAGDRLLLCTDGLFRSVAPEELTQLLASQDTPQGVAESLVGAALERDAEDNVTALVVGIG